MALFDNKHLFIYKRNHFVSAHFVFSSCWYFRAYAIISPVGLLSDLLDFVDESERLDEEQQHEEQLDVVVAGQLLQGPVQRG